MDYYNRKINNRPKYLNGLKKALRSPLMDRTGSLSMQHKILTGIPEVYAGDLKFGKIANRRANNIFKRCRDNNQDIRVCYSGGIDSTVAVVSLLKYMGKYPTVNVTLLMSQKSIKEYPLFYNKYLKDKINIRMSVNNDLNDLMCEPSTKDYVIVTGELGDQLFGSALMFRDLGKLSNNWIDEFSYDTVGFLTPLMMLNPDKDPSVANALWWINFTLKYQWVQLRMYIMAETVPYNKFVHFFGNEKFQQWSMNTPISKKFPDFNDPASYKMIAKKYILDFTGDKKYYKTKEKEGSLKGNVDVGIGRLLKRVKEDMSIVHIDTKVRVENKTIDDVVEIGVYWDV